jgi:hypothetical protein
MLLALSGLAGAGKSTAAKHLSAVHGFTLVKFAGPLKRMLRSIGLSEEEIEGGKKEVPSSLLCGKSPRHAMQTLGTEWGRDLIGPDFWVNLWEFTTCEVLSEGGKVVVDDCRFPNEAEMVRKLGGKIVTIQGPRKLSLSHASEQFLRGDYIIFNDETIYDLNRELDKLVEELHAKSL